MPGIDGIVADDMPSVNIIGKVLVVDERLLDGETEVSIYDAAGNLMSRNAVTTATQTLDGLTSGVAIIVVSTRYFGTKTFKIIL